ncbi:unnamed protein product [Cochlearia groenlandica]
MLEDEEEHAEEEEEKECEDWCFVCKDGGSLMLCDYKDCPKVYHAHCVEKDITVRKNEESLICRWHRCYLCKKRPTLYCLCCPHAVCKGCVTHAEFIRLKDDKGLCNQCEEYVIAIEEIQEYDAAGDKIDLTDRNTFECLFLEYWEIVKDKEDISFDDVRASKSRKKGVKSRYKDDPEFITDHEDEDAKDYKRTGKTKRMEFIGWGSKPLIDFLTSIGEDTKDAMSQYSVESVIRKYIRQKNLVVHAKKKMARCDDKLYSIFRKSFVNQKSIYTLLNAHFKENQDQLEYFKLLECGFSEKSEKDLVPCKKQKRKSPDDELCEEEVIPKMRPTGLATINADNIKHVYLRKSLVTELLKQNQGFEDKIVGSFVKVKNDPRDTMAYQILQVTGFKTAADQSDGVLLYVAGMGTGVSVSKLDDSDINKEEIEDLRQKVMNGLLRQPTVVEMKQKAKALHEDITKHEYLEERERLQRPSEQERLLKETPRIIEEVTEVKQEKAASSKQGNISGLSREAAIDID